MFILCLIVIMVALFISVMLSNNVKSLSLRERFYQQIK